MTPSESLYPNEPFDPSSLPASGADFTHLDVKTARAMIETSNTVPAAEIDAIVEAMEDSRQQRKSRREQVGAMLSAITEGAPTLAKMMIGVLA